MGFAHEKVFIVLSMARKKLLRVFSGRARGSVIMMECYSSFFSSFSVLLNSRGFHFEWSERENTRATESSLMEWKFVPRVMKRKLESRTRYGD
jgi:hypothetical protein